LRYWGVSRDAQYTSIEVTQSVEEAIERRGMSKGVVFFSHSSKDGSALLRLKEKFLAKTGGSIDVFLSGDGQSIPFGRNWVHRVEEGLNSSSVMFVFVTPNSLQSNWTHFEAGYAYSKNVRVVPIGFLGIDLRIIPAPLRADPGSLNS